MFITFPLQALGWQCWLCSVPYIQLQTPNVCYWYTYYFTLLPGVYFARVKHTFCCWLLWWYCQAATLPALFARLRVLFTPYGYLTLFCTASYNNCNYVVAPIVNDISTLLLWWTLHHLLIGCATIAPLHLGYIDRSKQPPRIWDPVVLRVKAPLVVQGGHAIY